MEIGRIVDHRPSAGEHLGLQLSASRLTPIGTFMSYPSRDVVAVDDHPGRDAREALRSGRMDAQGLVDDGLEIWQL